MFFPSEKMIPWLEKAMDLSYRRHTLLSGNIANVDTPDYIPNDLEFSDYLTAEIKNDFGGPNPGVPHSEQRDEVEPTLNGNQVDIEKEIVQLNSNRFFYYLSNEVIARSVSSIRYAIDEGGR